MNQELSFFISTLESLDDVECVDSPFNIAINANLNVPCDWVVEQGLCNEFRMATHCPLS